MELSHDRPARPYGLLYPMMLIAAIAVIVFSVLGIVSIAGWMPNAFSATTVTEPKLARDREGTAVPVSVRSAQAFECTECGVINSIRELEGSGGAVTNARAEVKPTSLRP